MDDVVLQAEEEMSLPAGHLQWEGRQFELDMPMTGYDLYSVPAFDVEEGFLPDVNLDMEASEMEVWDQQLADWERARIDDFMETDLGVEQPPTTTFEEDAAMLDLPRELPNQQAPEPEEISPTGALSAFADDSALLGEDEMEEENEEEEEEDDLDGDSDIFLDPSVLEAEEDESTTDKQPVVAANGEEQELPIDPQSQLAEELIRAPPTPQEMTPEPESTLFGSDPAEVEAPEEDVSTAAVEPAAVSEQQAPASPPPPPPPATNPPAPASRPTAVLIGGMWFPPPPVVQPTAPIQDEEESQQPAEVTRTLERTPEAATGARQQDGSGPLAPAPEPTLATPSRDLPSRRKPNRPSCLRAATRTPQGRPSATTTRSGEGGSADRERTARHSTEGNLLRRDLGMPAGAGAPPKGTTFLSMKVVLADQARRAQEGHGEAE